MTPMNTSRRQSLAKRLKLVAGAAAVAGILGGCAFGSQQTATTTAPAVAQTNTNSSITTQSSAATSQLSAVTTTRSSR